MARRDDDWFDRIYAQAAPIVEAPEVTQFLHQHQRDTGGMTAQEPRGLLGRVGSGVGGFLKDFAVDMGRAGLRTIETQETRGLLSRFDRNAEQRIGKKYPGLKELVSKASITAKRDAAALLEEGKSEKEIRGFLKSEVEGRDKQALGDTLNIASLGVGGGTLGLAGKGLTQAIRQGGVRGAKAQLGKLAGAEAAIGGAGGAGYQLGRDPHSSAREVATTGLLSAAGAGALAPAIPVAGAALGRAGRTAPTVRTETRAARAGRTADLDPDVQAFRQDNLATFKPGASDNLLSFFQRLGGRRLKEGISPGERIISKTQDDAVTAMSRTADIKQGFNDIIKRNRLSGKERVRVGDLIEGRATPDKVDPRVARAADEYRKLNRQIWEERNARALAEGREAIPFRENHFHHHIKDRPFEPSIEDGFMPQDLRAGAAKPRKGHPNYERDPFKAAVPYTDMMMKDAYMSPGLNRLTAVRNDLAARGMSKEANWLTTQIKHNVLNKPDHLIKGAVPTGTARRQFVSGVQRIRAQSALGLNPRFWITQTLSAANLLGEAKPISFVQGAAKFLTSKAQRQRVKGYTSYKTKELTAAARTGMGDLEAGTKLVQGKVEGFMNWASRKVELNMQGLALSVGEQVARRNGLRGRDARIAADQIAQVTQSMYDVLNRAQGLNPLEVRATAPFQTFSFEMFRAAKRYAGVGGGRIEGAGTRAAQATSLFAGLWATNQLTQMIFGQKKTTAGTFIPIVGNHVDMVAEEVKLRTQASLGNEEAQAELERRDEQSILERYAMPKSRFPIALGEDIASVVEAGKRYVATGDLKGLREELVFWGGGALGMGGGQMNRMIDGIIANIEGFTPTKTKTVETPEGEFISESKAQEMGERQRDIPGERIPGIRAPIGGLRDRVQAILFGPHATPSTQRSFSEDRPALTGQKAKDFIAIEDPKERQRFFDTETEKLKNFFADRRDLDKAAKELSTEAQSAYEDWVSPPKERTIHNQADRYRGLVNNPEALALVMERESRKAKRGEETSPLFTPGLLTDEQRKRILMYRGAAVERSAGLDRDKDGETLFTALGLDEDWYNEFREIESAFYRLIGQDGTREDMTISGAPRPELPPELEAVQSYYHSLPKRTGQRKSFLNTPEGQRLLEYWADRDAFTNLERLALGLRPMGGQRLDLQPLSGGLLENLRLGR